MSHRFLIGSTLLLGLASLFGGAADWYYTSSDWGERDFGAQRSRLLILEDKARSEGHEEEAKSYRRQFDDLGVSFTTARR